MAAVSSSLAGRTWSHWSSLCLPNLAFWFSLSPQHRYFVSRAHGVWLCSCPIPLQAGNFAVAETVALWVEMDLLPLICSCMVVSPFSGLSCLGEEAAGPLCFIFIVQYLPGVQNVFTGWMMRRRDGGSGSFSFKILQMTCLPSPAGNSNSPWKRSLHRIPPVPADHHTPFHLGRAEERMWGGDELKIRAYFPGVNFPAIGNSSTYNCGFTLMEPLKQTFYTPC